MQQLFSAASFWLTEVSRYHFLFLFAVAVAGVGQVVLKKAALEKSRSLLRQYANWHVILGYFLFLVSMGMASFAYRGIPLKAGPALDSLGFVLVPLLSWIFFGEKLTRAKGLGFLLIVCGVLIFGL